MNIKLRRKNCSGQSRYGRYGSSSTVLGVEVLARGRLETAQEL